MLRNSTPRWPQRRRTLLTRRRASPRRERLWSVSDAEERLAAANVAASQTAIKSSDAQAERATADSRRYAALVSSGAVARRDADSFRAGAVTAEQDAAHSVAMLDVAKDSLSVTVAKRATLLAALQKANANIGRARSAVDLARQDQRHTLILAPSTASSEIVKCSRGTTYNRDRGY